MDLITTDHNVLLQKFDDTRNEMHEMETCYRILHPCARYDSKFYMPYEREKRNLSILYDSSKEITYNQPSKFNDLPESSEESIQEDEPQRKKVCLKSAVIAKRRNFDSRKDVISKQNINYKVQIRNRRILGILQRTLQKFQDDAIKRQPQDMKRKRLEQKVESANEEETERLRREEKLFLHKMREKRLQLDCLTDMLMITESFEAWKCNKKNLLRFIITKAEPHICYLPMLHTPSSKKLLEKSRAEVQKSIRRQEATVKMELVKIKDSYHLPDLISIEKNLELSQD